MSCQSAQLRFLVLVTMVTLGSTTSLSASGHHKQVPSTGKKSGFSGGAGPQQNQLVACGPELRKERDLSLPVVAYGDQRFRFGGGIYSLDYSPDVKWLATCGGGWGPVLWDASTGKMVREFPGPEPSRRVIAASFSPDGTLLASTGIEKVRIWTVATGTLLYELKCPAARAVFTPDGKHLLVAGWGGSAVFVETKTGRQVQELARGGNAFESATVSPDSSRAVIVVSGVPRIWNLITGEETRPRLEPGEKVQSAKFTPDGRLLALIHGSGGEFLRLTDGDTSKNYKTCFDASRLHTFDISPDGNLSAVITFSGDVALIDLTTGRAIRRWPTAARRVVFSPDGKSIATASPIRIWDTATGEEKYPHREGRTATAREMAMLPDGRTLMTRDARNRVVHRNMDTGQVTRRVVHAYLGPFIQAMCPQTGGVLSSDVRTMGTDSRLKGSQLIAFLNNPENRVTNACFSANGDRVAVLGRPEQLAIFDRRTGKQLHQLGPPRPPGIFANYVSRIAMSADGTRVVFENGTSRQVWNAETGQRLPMPPRGENYRFAPDGTLAIIRQNEILFWDVDLGKHLCTLTENDSCLSVSIPPPHEAGQADRRISSVVKQEIGAVAFSPDGKLMAHARKLSGREVVLWDLQAGQIIRELRGTPSGAAVLCFSPDSRKLYAGTNSTLTVGWDLSQD